MANPPEAKDWRFDNDWSYDNPDAVAPPAPKGAPKQEWTYDQPDPAPVAPTATNQPQVGAPVTAPAITTPDPEAYKKNFEAQHETRIVYGDELGDSKRNIKNLSEAGKKRIEAYMLDPKNDWNASNEFAKAVQKAEGLVGTGIAGNQEELAAYQAQGKLIPSEFASSWDGVLQNVEPTVDEKFDREDPENAALISTIGSSVPNAWNQLKRGFQQELQTGFSGMGARGILDMFDVGKDQLARMYPEASPEQLEQMQEQLVNRTQRLVRELDAGETTEDNMILNFIGAVPSSAGLEDLVAPGSTIAKRLATAFLANTFGESIYQTADVAQGVRDEMSLQEIGMAGLMGVGFQGVFEIPGALFRKKIDPDKGTIELRNEETGELQQVPLEDLPPETLDAIETQIEMDFEAKDLPSAKPNPYAKQVVPDELPDNAVRLADVKERKAATTAAQERLNTEWSVDKLSDPEMGEGNIKALEDYVAVREKEVLTDPAARADRDMIVDRAKRNIQEAESRVAEERSLAEQVKDSEAENVADGFEDEQLVFFDNGMPLAKDAVDLRMGYPDADGNRTIDYSDGEGNVYRLAQTRNADGNLRYIVREAITSEGTAVPWMKEGDTFGNTLIGRPKWDDPAEVFLHTLKKGADKERGDSYRSPVRNEAREAPYGTLVVRRTQPAYAPDFHEFAVVLGPPKGGERLVDGFPMPDNVLHGSFRLDANGDMRSFEVWSSQGAHGVGMREMNVLRKKFEGAMPHVQGIYQATRITGARERWGKVSRKMDLPFGKILRDADGKPILNEKGKAIRAVPPIVSNVQKLDNYRDEVTPLQMDVIRAEINEIVDMIDGEIAWIRDGTSEGITTVDDLLGMMEEAQIEEMAFQHDSIEVRHEYRRAYEAIRRYIDELSGETSRPVQYWNQPAESMRLQGANDADIAATVAKVPENYQDMDVLTASQVRWKPEDAANTNVETTEVDAAIRGVQERIGDVGSDWKGGPEIRVIYGAEGIDDLDARADFQNAEDAMGPDSVKGFQKGGVVYLNAKNTATRINPSAVLYHEALGHFGLAKQFGKAKDTFLYRVYQTNKGMRDKADAYVLEHKAAYPFMSASELRLIGVEESLVALSERGLIKASVMAKISAVVRAFGRKAGLKLGYSNREIVAILAQSHANVTQGSKNVAFNGAHSNFSIDNTTGRNRGSQYAGPINKDHISSSHDIGEILDQAASNYSPPSPQSHEATARLAAELGLTVEQLLKNRPEFTPEYMLAARQLLTSSSNRVFRHARELTENYSDEVALQLARSLATNQAVFARVAGMAHAAGSVLDSFNIDAKGRTGGAAINFALKNGGGIFANPENMPLLAKKILEFEKNPAAMRRLMSSATSPRASDYFFSVWYNFVLSGPQTHIANVMGTGSNLTMDSVEKLGAVVLGQAGRVNPANKKAIAAAKVADAQALTAKTEAALLKSNGDTVGAKTARDRAKSFEQEAQRLYERGERLSGTEFVARHVGMLAGVKAGFRNFPKAFALGVPLHRVSRVEKDTSVFKDTPLAFIEAPVRLLAATDEFFRSIMTASDYYGMAVRIAKVREGRKGADMWKRAQELIDKPTEEMITKAGDFAQIMQFLDDPKLPFAKQLEKGRSAKIDDNWYQTAWAHTGRMIAPFVRTPDSLLRTGARRSGLALLSPTNIADLKAGGARRGQAITRVGMGMALTSYIFDKIEQGEITGEGPADYRKREQMMALVGEDGEALWRPNSVKIFDTWYSYQGMEPLSIPFGVMATVSERYKEKKARVDADPNEEWGWGDAGAVTFSAFAASLTNNTWTSGIKDFVTALEDQGTTVENYVAGTLASMTVPSIVRQVNKAFNPEKRITTGDGTGLGRYLGRVKSSIPWLSETLPQAYDILGNPQRAGNAPGDNVFSNMLLRLQKAPTTNDPVIKELGGLAGQFPGTMISPVSKSNVTTQDGVRDLEDFELYSYQRLTGEILYENFKGLMGSEDYKKLSDKQRAEAAKELGTEARKEARETLFGVPSKWEYTDEATGWEYGE
jgi:hypothetical protein